MDVGCASYVASQGGMSPELRTTSNPSTGLTLRATPANNALRSAKRDMPLRATRVDTTPKISNSPKHPRAFPCRWPKPSKCQWLKPSKCLRRKPSPRQYQNPILHPLSFLLHPYPMNPQPRPLHRWPEEHQGFRLEGRLRKSRRDEGQC